MPPDRRQPHVSRGAPVGPTSLLSLCPLFALLAGEAGVPALHAAPPTVREPLAQAVAPCTVRRIIDGDTFVCESGERVRLILVNTPEMSDEPLGRMARTFLRGLMPPGTEVKLEMDVGERDRYGRLLAYVRLPDGRMVNRILAREGYAQVMVVQPNVRHVETIRAAADSARREDAGLWGRRPGFERDPRLEPIPRSRDSSGDGCHAAYPGVCIPPPPPDLDCRDIVHRRFQVRPPDPHRFDGDGNGVGCEGG